jgi:hypothetical protein
LEERKKNNNKLRHYAYHSCTRAPSVEAVPHLAVADSEAQSVHFPIDEWRATVSSGTSANEALSISAGRMCVYVV